MSVEIVYRTEPKVVFATVRDAIDDIHIECRFSDGQKFAAITVDSEFPSLARQICEMLNEDAKQNGW